MTPDLLARAENLGVAALVRLALAGLLSVVLLFIHALGDVFRDRNSQKNSVPKQKEKSR